MRSRDFLVGAALPASAPLPALVVGIAAMQQLGVAKAAAVNVGATVLGLLIWGVGRRFQSRIPAARAWLAGMSMAAILLPFAFEGVLGVHRWVPVAGLRLHASAIVAPLIIWCVAAAAPHRISSALAISATSAMILALQPDAAQTTSLAAACAVVLISAGKKHAKQISVGVALLAAASVVSFLRHDPLPPVAHVEEIFSIVTSRGAGPAAVATVALLLMPVPFFAAWYRHRRPVTLALGVYVVMTLLAPAWGTFPVPVMGYGASPILGYFIALMLGVAPALRDEELSSGAPPMGRTQTSRLTSNRD